MRFLQLLALFVLSCSGAYAQDQLGQDVVEALNAKEMCRFIANYQDGDAAAYQPGVDVKGDAVAPADLNPPIIIIEQPIVVPIEIDILERFDIVAPEGVELKPEFARIAIHRDGRVEFNGQEITQRSAFVCSQERLKARGIRSSVTIEGKKVVPQDQKSEGHSVKAQAGYGQSSMDAINIEAVPVIPPQEPIWNNDEILTGEGQ